jgi:hypothetical protein
MRKIIFLSAWIIAILILSCQQELPAILNQVQSCKVIRGYYYGGSAAINDSADFVYDAAGKLIKWTGNDGYYDYFYNGSRITARIFHEKTGGLVLFIDSARYDSQNNVSELVFYDYSGWYGYDSSRSVLTFQYQDNQLKHITNINYFDQGFGIETDTVLTNVFWNAAGNIDKMVFIDNFNNSYDSILYQYNADPNYFKLANPQFFLFDPGFELHAGFEPHLAYFYSRNNVINFNIYGGFNYPITYGHDSLNHVTSIDMGGFEYMKYKYECQ